ncbi:MAG: LacI family DNA-binding transcriptional regulator [Acidimicrobiaceae bacterium]|nr:LacI family DNA-binding transcriptional regulator [Acidimicrobiaceae bacterium]MCY4176453.1 LacI family DNA-binding transcriptional regulator [Acidimicrobiaceae bacterium]MCY4280108.1 LacI family DNA-binding transcriptional regulator [Acidimicrobiaceae bacterium]MCY4294753.1 LacI family DNA-binding transcriptional regulator [Acidimicrobiaceae bacterium]
MSSATATVAVNRPTMQDVALRAGVSRALVSLVMNKSPRVSDQKRRAVLRAAAELGYRPNLPARQLARRRTHTIGVLVDNLRNPFFGEVVDGIEAEAADNDYSVLILNGRREAQREIEAVETFLQAGVEAIALVGTRFSADELDRLRVTTPCVVVAGGASYSVSTVGTDDRLGAELAVQHLAALGHSRISHLDGGRSATAEQRSRGYRSGMKLAGLEQFIDVRGGGDQEADAAEAIDELLAVSDPPTAIFAFNDLLAAGALNRLDEAGVPVPSAMSLVGFDNTFISALRHLSLTTINQPTLAMGRLAATTLLAQVSDGSRELQRHTLQPEIVVRSTTCPPRTGPLTRTR